MNHYEKDEFFNGATGQRGNGATGRCKFCLLGVSLAILFTIFSCQKEEQLLLEESAASENPIAARSTGLMSDSIWAKPSVDQLNALWGAMMAEATVDDIGGFLYQHGLFEWSLAKVVKEFDTGSYVLSVPTVMEGDVASILFVYVENSNYAYWHIPLSELENDTQVLLDRYGASDLIVAIFSFLQYGQVWGDSEYGFLYEHLAHPSLAEQFLEIVPRGWCLIEIELYTTSVGDGGNYDFDGCNCSYRNKLTDHEIMNPPSGFDPSIDDPTWLDWHSGQPHMWEVFSTDPSIIHGTPGEYGTTVYHFWAWCPDEFDQTPWGFNFTSNFDPRGGDGNGPAPPVWDYDNPRWDEDTRGCMFAFNDPKATEKINQLEEALLTQSCGDAAEFIVKNIIDNIVIGLCNEYYDGLDEGTNFPNGTAHDMNETLEQLTTTVESHSYYQIGLAICEVCDNAPSPLQVSQCYQAVNSCGTAGYEECVEDALFQQELSKKPSEGSEIDLSAVFEDCFGEPDVNGNYIDCSQTGNSTFELTLFADQPNPGTRDPFSGNPISGISVGHTFVSLTANTNTGEVKTVTYGFYPSLEVNLNNTTVPMAIYDDSGHAYTASVTIPLSCSEFNTALITSVNSASNNYNLNDYNCTDYGVEVANSVGLGVANSSSPWVYLGKTYGNSSNPSDLGEDIKELPNGLVNMNGETAPSTNCN